MAIRSPLTRRILTSPGSSRISLRTVLISSALASSIVPLLRTSLPTGSINSISRVLSSSASNRIRTTPDLTTTNTMASAPESLPNGKSEEEWRTVLSPAQFKILREKGTEAAFKGEYDKHYPSEGVYGCAACGTPLYTATTKFKSGCGWPAFYDAIPGAVNRHTDNTWGMSRTEITCAACGGHLGHVFKGEGFKTPTDERHCVNSISLSFKGDKSDA